MEVFSTLNDSVTPAQGHSGIFGGKGWILYHQSSGSSFTRSGKGSSRCHSHLELKCVIFPNAGLSFFRRIHIPQFVSHSYCRTLLADQTLAVQFCDQCQ